MRLDLANKYFFSDGGIPHHQFMLTQKLYARESELAKEEVKERQEEHTNYVGKRYDTYEHLSEEHKSHCPESSKLEILKIYGMIEDTKLMANVRAKATLASGAFTEDQVNLMMEQEKTLIFDKLHN